MTLRQIAFYSRIGLHAASGQKTVFVLAYPRSGSSWLSRLVAGALEIPYGGRSWVAPQVIHMHRFVVPALIQSRTIYIVRDCRDTLLSYSNALMSELEQDLISEQRIRQLLGEGRECLDPRAPEFALFVNWWMSTRFVSTNWVEHVRLARRYRFTHVRYEDLFRDPSAALSDLLLRCKRVPRRSTAAVVEEHALERERAKGLPVRTGGVEKWRQYGGCRWVSEVSAWAEDELKQLGYEC